jgi:Carboxypeptidase regulatory-like domain/TonB dependent receptor
MSSDSRVQVRRLFAVAALLAVPLGVAAQDSRAKLTVTITDPSGSPVKSANVELKNNATAQVTKGLTNESGVYTFLFVPPGTYTVSADAAGFAVAERPGIILQPFQSSDVGLQLSLGTTKQSVTVSGEPALLDTQSASREQDISGKLVIDLPMPNHNPVMLLQDVPGVFIRPLGVYTDPWTITSQFLINGGLMYLNEFQIDGAPNDAELGNNTYGYTPPAEAVASTNVNANAYDAMYGHTSGGVIDIDTKSGTSDFHGVGWAYFKRTGWDANTFQNNFIGAPRTPSPQNQWGLQVSGPAYIPKLLTKNSKLKAFYLFSYDNYWELLPHALIGLSVPTPEMRHGDFSRLTDANGNQIKIYDPLSATTSGGNRTQFPGNIIPNNRINPVAATLISYFPQPNSPSSPLLGYSKGNFNLPSNTNTWNFYNVLVRGDFNIGDKFRFFVRPAHSLFTETSNFNGVTGPGLAGGQFSRMNSVLLTDFVAMPNPTTVINVRLNASLFRPNWQSPPNRGFDPTKLGLPASMASQLENGNTFGQWNSGSYDQLGWFSDVTNTETYSLEGSLNKFLGNHNIRSGIDLRLTHYQTYHAGVPFAFNFGTDMTQLSSTSASESGNEIASLLIGQPSSGSANINPALFYSTWYIAPWVQDDWKVTPRLTINYGLRYDLNTPPTERYNRLNDGFDANAASPLVSQIPASVISQFPQLADLKGVLTFAGVNGRSQHPFFHDYRDFQPRVGVAYKLSDRLVLRGGYGLFFTNFQDNAMLQNIGFSATTPLVTANNPVTPIPNLLSNPYPSGITEPTGASLGGMTALSTGFNFWNPHYKMPRAHEFSFGFQYRVSQNGVLDVSYVGNRVRDYAGNIQVNVPSAAFMQPCNEMTGGIAARCEVTGPFPLYGVTAAGSKSTMETAWNFDNSRPFPQFWDVQELGANIGKDWYNGLQISYSHRYSHGLTFNTSYVWSKQIEQWGWIDQYRQIPQRSPYYLEHPHVFKIFGSYDLPFGRGRTFALGNNRIADLFLGGWVIAPSVNIQTGEPAALPNNAVMLSPANAKHINWSASSVRGWSNCVLNEDANGNIAPMPYSLQAGCGTDRANYDWLVYTLPPGPGGTFSAESFNSSTLFMKPQVFADISLGKTISVWEKMKIDFRATATNLFNHYNWLTTRFNTNAFDPNFGTVQPQFNSSLDTVPRVIQLGVRVLW